MTGAQSWAAPGGAARQRRASDRVLDIYRTVVWVYGGFLLGTVSHAGWLGDDDLVFWPWSSVFLLLLVGLIIWQRRRSPGASVQRQEDDQVSP